MKKKPSYTKGVKSLILSSILELLFFAVAVHSERIGEHNEKQPTQQQQQYKSDDIFQGTIIKQRRTKMTRKAGKGKKDYNSKEDGYRDEAKMLEYILLNKMKNKNSDWLSVNDGDSDTFLRNHDEGKRRRHLEQLRDDIALFKLKHDIRKDAILEMYYIDTITNTISIDIAKKDQQEKKIQISLNNLEPYNVFSPTAVSRLDNYERSSSATSLQNLSKSRIFVGTISKNYSNGSDIVSDSVMAIKDHNSDTFLEIFIFGQDGSFTYLANVDGGVMALLTSEMMIDNDNISALRSRTSHDTVTLNNSGGNGGNIFERNHNRLLQSTTTCTEIKIIDIRMFYDSSFCIQEGGSDNAIDSITRNVALASQIYQAQEICTNIIIHEIEGFCDPSLDPFVVGVARGNIGCGGIDGVVQYFVDWLTVNRPNLLDTADTAHMFFAEEFNEGTVGCASQSTLCLRTAYGVENMSFSQDDVRRSALFAHELGHNIGVDHVTSPADVAYVMGNIDYAEHIWSPTNNARLIELTSELSCIRRSTNSPTIFTPLPPIPPRTVAPMNPPPAITTTMNPIPIPTLSPQVAIIPVNTKTKPERGIEYKIQSLYNGSNLCFNVGKVSSRVGLWKCNGNDRQSWIIDSNGHLHNKLYYDKCLQMDSNEGKGRTQLRLNSCRFDGLVGSKQTWSYNKRDGQLSAKQFIGEKCVRVFKKGRPVYTSDCNDVVSDFNNPQSLIFVQ